MSNSGRNRSEEVVGGRSRESRQAAECLEKCLKVLPNEQRESILKYYGDENQLPPDLAISIFAVEDRHAPFARVSGKMSAGGKRKLVAVVVFGAEFQLN